MEFKEYKKLNKFEEYDHDAAEELAAALTEMSVLGKRMRSLEELVNENPELHTFVWTQADGTSIALHQIEDGHFTNILQHIVNRGDSINKSLRAEARRRKIELPDHFQSLSLSRRALVEGELVNDDDEADGSDQPATYGGRTKPYKRRVR